MRGRGSRRRRLASGGGVLSLLLALGCLAAGPAGAALIDNRGWEMVSPVDKNGGHIDPPGSIAGGGVLQAAAAGGAVTYSSRSSFGAGAAGAPPASQYVSVRGAGGWATANLTVPILSGTYDLDDEGAPYQLFSPDLARGLLLNGSHCRGEATGCPVANPPLPGTDAPEGFQNYYLREGGTFEALVGAADVAGKGLDPATFDLRFAGASPSLGTIVVSTCSRLTAAAVDGCGSGQPNLYRWQKATGALTLINVVPGAALAAQAGAVSADGSRIYWTDTVSGDLHRWESGSSTQVDAAAGGDGSFETASVDGSVAYFTKAGHLWRHAGGGSTDITPSGGVAGVLGASASGATVYFQDAGGLRRWSGGATATVAAGGAAAHPSTYPPTTGRARVSADGTKLLFVSTESLTGYDNLDKVTGQPDSQVFLYDADAGLRCVSCNPQGKRPIGPSTIPGAVANGTAAGSTFSYKPRALSANGRRVFFDSADALVAGDSNTRSATGAGIPDVYEWEARGEGTCATAGGCVGLISSGSAADQATFADASADGGDAYFLTDASLVPGDPGSGDLYDARVGGGFPLPPRPIPCEGDACQVLPAAPLDPSIATLQAGVGNPPVVYRKYCRKGYVKRKGICVKKGAKKRAQRRRGKHTRRGKRGKRGKQGQAGKARQQRRAVR